MTNELLSFLFAGSYDAQKYNAGSDYSESDSSNGKFTHQSSGFGHGAEADATASGTFINQNQAFARPNAEQNGFAPQGSSNGGGFDASGQSGASGHFGSNGQNPNKGQGFLSTGASNFAQFGQNAVQGEASQSSEEKTEQYGNAPQRFGNGASVGSKGPQKRPGQNGNGAINSFVQSKPSSNGFNSFSQSSQSSSFGNNNEYLPPVKTFNQNGRPGVRPNSRPQGSEVTSSEESSSSSEESNESAEALGAIPLSQQAVEKRPQESSFSSFGKPNSNGFSGQPGQTGRRPSQPGRPGRPGQSGFGLNADVAAQSPNKPAINSFSQSTQSSQESNIGLGNNEYLPPTSSFNQNRRPTQNQQGLNDASQFNQQQYNSNPQISGNRFSQSSQPGIQAQPSQFNGFQRPQLSGNSKPSFQNGNSRFPSPNLSQSQFASSVSSAQNGAPAPTSIASFNTQKPTLQPATELVTPIESDNTDDSQSSSQTTSTDFNTASSNGRPGQSQFGFNSNSQNASPIPTSSSAFPAFSSQTTSAGRPQKPQTFGGKPTQYNPTFSSQTSQGTFEQSSQFGDKQSDFAENIASNDVQYSSSTQKPIFAQQSQGPDDSYYYNQPSKPFGPPQGSRFPNAPSNQFNRVTMQAMFSQNNGQFPTQNIQNTPLSQNGQSQGSIKYPRPPTVAPSTTQNQNGQIGGSSKYPRPPTLAPVTGITQASISSFPSEAPTQATQFESQSQFGSRPSLQEPIQFNQAQVAQPGRPAFGQQPSTIPQSFPQRIQSQGQQAFEKPQALSESSKDATQEVTNQQYNGEIYEYNKPAQTLPAPSDKESSSGSGQFGQKVQGQFSQTKPQLGQSESSEIEQNDSTPDEGFQKPEKVQGFQSGAQFGARPSRPLNGQNAQGSRPQFGTPTQTSNRFEAQSSQEENKPQSFESQPASQEAQVQTKPQFGNTIRPACCQSLQAQFGSPAKPTQGFGAQSSFSAAQSSKTEAVASSFTGKGEVFGSPDRKPPSFDEETGYHY